MDKWNVLERTEMHRRDICVGKTLQGRDLFGDFGGARKIYY